MKRGTNLTTTEVLMLDDGGFLLKTLGEKTLLSLVEEVSSQHTQSKLDDTHPMCDNKAVHRVQPTVDHFTNLD